MSEPVLQIQGLRKAYGALTVTDNLSMTVEAGSIHALIGMAVSLLGVVWMSADPHAFNDWKAILLITVATAFWGMTLVVALPFMVAAYRKLEALALILVFIGGKVFVAGIAGWEKFPASISLGVTVALLAGGIGYSLWRTHAARSQSTG